MKAQTIKPIVFLGLSLDELEARAILDADYRGPIVRGDLDSIDAPSQVVIIDGILDVDKRLGTQEVANALNRGLALHGASSLGALLSVQFGHAGMRGYGFVFDTLRSLKHKTDEFVLQDLIKALYVSGSFKPLTVPLIEPIAYCRKAGYSIDQLEVLVSVLCKIPLDDRSWANIKKAVGRVGMSLPLMPDVSGVKHDDARKIIKMLEADLIKN